MSSQAQHRERSRKAIAELAVKIVVLAALVGGVAATGRTDDQKADATGTWEWVRKSPDGQESEIMARLKQEGNKLTGKVTTEAGEIDITNGTVMDGNVIFEISSDADGSQIHVKFTGRLQGDSIKGKAEITRDGNTMMRDWEPKRITEDKTEAPSLADVVAKLDAKIRTLQIDAWARPSVGQFVPADDIAQYLVYELYVTNWNGPPGLRFATVDVEDAATGKRLARLDTVALETPSTLRITPDPGIAGPRNRLLPPGRTAIIRMEVKLPLGASVPAAVRHRIAFESDPAIQMIQDDGSLSSELVAFSESMPIDRARPIAIVPPLLGGPWYCNNGIGAFTNHDWIGALDRTARLYAGARFGCDLFKAGAASDINSYGADVIAVADGRVVKAQDGVPENVRQDGGGYIMPVPLTNKTLAGNMIVLEIGKERYAYYAHLQLGSLRVKVGDRVRKGQLLAKVGNSGNATGPHLHFHVCKGEGPITCDAVPYVYTSYWLSGHLMWNPKRTRRVEFQVPTNGSIMTFSGSGDFGPLEVASKEPDWSVHDTLAQQYPMERSPRIEIRGVTGPIVISSGPTRTADISVQRSAGTRRELDCFQTRIDHRPDLITISYVQFTDRPGCGSIGSRQALTLEVPFDAFLELSNIYYSTVKITGPVQGVIAENIGGHVSIAEAGTVNLRKLGNGVSLGLGAASTGPATMESVFGDVELDVAGRRDVEIHASSIVGEIRSVPSDFVRLKTDEGYLLKSRAGGTSISLKRIDGDIVLKRQ